MRRVREAERRCALRFVGTAPRWARVGRLGLGRLGLGLLWLASATVAGANDEPVLDARVDRTRVAEGGVITLTLTLEGFSRDATGPDLPDLEGFEVYDAGHGTNITLINGRLSQSTSYTYQLVARRAGQFTLGPIKVSDRGRLYTTEPLTLTVVPASTGTGQSPSGTPPGASPGARTAPSGASDDDGLFAELVVDKEDAYVDEQILLRFLLYQRVDVRVYELSGFSPPTTEGFWREDLGQQPERRVRRDGDIYTVREVAWAIYPTREGELQIGPGTVTAHLPERSRRLFGGLLNRRQVPIGSNRLTLRVKPLPEQGRPETFTGSVGRFEIEAAFDSPQAYQGEALALTVTVRGEGHVQTIGAPAWPEWEGLRVFDSGEAVSVRKRLDGVEGEKTFTQVLIPTRTGALSLPPIRFSYFDPRRAAYATVRTPPLELEVGPARQAGASDGPTDVVALGEDMLYIHTDLASSLRTAGSGGWSGGWLLHLIPVAAVVGALWIRRRRDALERDPALARRVSALKRAVEGLRGLDAAAGATRLAGDLADIVEGFLGDWIDTPVRGMRRAELEQTLHDAGAPGPLVAGLMDQLTWADEVRFGAGAAGRPAGRVEETERLMRAFDAAMRAGAPGGRSR